MTSSNFYHEQPVTMSATCGRSWSPMQDISSEQLALISGGVPEPSCTAVRVRDGYVIVCK